MNADPKLYTLAYFFTAEGMQDVKAYLEVLKEQLRTVDPDAPAAHQPEFVDNNSIGFMESVTSEQLKGFDDNLRLLFGHSFALHKSIMEMTGQEGGLGLTIYVKDSDEKTCMLFTQTSKEHEALFSYQKDIKPDSVVTPATVTMVPSGKDMVHAMLSFFGELEQATGQALN